ncbi:hypothetical protein [Sphaerisporangium dianthi]|uniref:Uncharacterized protein n=1 Tax=Sphaerisporangium dianthi TaxID=1436120 RepID=A0ABV9CHD5_9ACTN
MSGEQGDEAVGCVVAEARLEVAGCLGGGFGAAGEQGVFAFGERALDVMRAIAA